VYSPWVPPALALPTHSLADLLEAAAGDAPHTVDGSPVTVAPNGGDAAPERAYVVEAGGDRDVVVAVDRDPAAVPVARDPGQATGERAHAEIAVRGLDERLARVVDQLPRLRLRPPHPGDAVAERLDVGVPGRHDRLAVGNPHLGQGFRVRDHVALHQERFPVGRVQRRRVVRGAVLAQEGYLHGLPLAYGVDKSCLSIVGCSWPARQ